MADVPSPSRWSDSHPPEPQPSDQPNVPPPVVVDCDGCAVRGLACDDCVVTVLLGPTISHRWDSDEMSALDALAGAGLVPPLRLVEAVDAADMLGQAADLVGQSPDIDPEEGSDHTA